jgi:NADPH-dependent 2,4-dienoyl-CoA reductase/sulfur reductase-like enzyme
MTVGGGQTLLKGQQLLPGRRVLLAGTGPLLLVVAAQFARAGAEIVAACESARALPLLGRLPALLGQPALLAQGISYRLALLARAVPWLAPTVLVRVEGGESVEAAVVAGLDASGRLLPGSERRLACDVVLVGYGLIPSLELARLLGCAVRWDEERRSFVPERSADFETTVRGVYAVGDGAGVAGAVVAAEEGRVAALAAARALGRLSADETRERQRPALRRLDRLHAFRRAMDEVYRLPPALFELAGEETVVCRCEEVTLRELRAAIDDGARNAAQLKLWTRAGMGPCQGRMCHLPTLEILARATGAAIAENGPYSVRAPVKPLDIEALLRE